MSNKFYNTAKWIVLTVLPAISVFIMTVGTKIGIANPDDVVTVLNAGTVLLGAILGVSSIQYQKGQDQNTDNSEEEK
ncbi:phage holin [Enterococcus faecalis]